MGTGGRAFACGGVDGYCKDGDCRPVGLEYIDGAGATPLSLFNALMQVFDGTVMYSGSLHSMQRFRRFEQGRQTKVCPHGKTTGGRSFKQNSSKQMTQWKGTTEAVAAATLVL